MPELPEVESVRASLERRVQGCTVSGVVVRRRDVIATAEDPPGGYSRQRREIGPKRQPRRVAKPELLVGSVVDSVRRHGKQLALVGRSCEQDGEQDGGVVLIHLGMTGEVMAPGPGGRLRAADHVHVLWTLHHADGSPAGRMAFRDPRRFGGIWTLPDLASLEARWAELGPDGLVITGQALGERAGRSRRAVKASLLDQRVVAGVGNIYADESLFRAGILPTRPSSDLTAAQWDRLAEEIRGLLRQAIEMGGSTLRDYRDASGAAGTATQLHQVYGKAGESCPICGEALVSEGVAQRTTVWCETCQR